MVTPLPYLTTGPPLPSDPSGKSEITIGPSSPRGTITTRVTLDPRSDPEETLVEPTLSLSTEQQRGVYRSDCSTPGVIVTHLYFQDLEWDGRCPLLPPGWSGKDYSSPDVKKDTTNNLISNNLISITDFQQTKRPEGERTGNHFF